MEKLKKSWLLISLGLGGLIGFLCAWVNTFYMIFTLPLFFVTGNFNIIMLVTACIIAPFVEELSKPIGVYLIKMEEKTLLSVKNWMILGTFAGLGFGLMENSIMPDKRVFAQLVKFSFPVPGNILLLIAQPLR